MSFRLEGRFGTEDGSRRDVRRKGSLLNGDEGLEEVKREAARREVLPVPAVRRRVMLMGGLRGMVGAMEVVTAGGDPSRQAGE